MARRSPRDWLFSLERFGMKLGLEAMTGLLDALHRPGLGRPAVLVAGTNGKGSVATTTAALLTAAGVRTLCYTSPHVVSVRERITVDGRRIPVAALDRHLETVRRVITTLRRHGALPHHPTFFEVLTAAALLHGRARRAQALVLEVGLGGRHDATNVVPAPVAVITSIDHDHERQLGHTLARIAANKAGIIRPAAVVVSAVDQPAARRVLRAVTRRQQARLRQVPASAARCRPSGCWDLTLAGGRWAAGLPLPAELEATRLGLAGPAQGRQAIVAALAAAALSAHLQGTRLTRSSLRRGLRAAYLPGRYECRRARGGRPVLLDAAHNPAACAALAGAVRRMAGVKSWTLLFGVMRDKDAAAMAASLFPLAAEIVLCRPRHPRAADPRSLRRLAPVNSSSRVIDDPERAWAEALRLTPAGGALLVTGSFYLLGDLAPHTQRLPRKRA